MLTTSQLTPAQRRIRESLPKSAAHADLIAQHRMQLPRVRESLTRIADEPRA